ncbi:hypothetical protein AGMMS50256_10550 [Betaproteobacteria bacterium]|nr:hypothetical protein AGMMS50256_10550 [Betaproteobacteria bacterium]
MELTPALGGAAALGITSFSPTYVAWTLDLGVHAYAGKREGGNDGVKIACLHTACLPKKAAFRAGENMPHVFLFPFNPPNFEPNLPLPTIVLAHFLSPRHKADNQKLLNRSSLKIRNKRLKIA